MITKYKITAAPTGTPTDPYLASQVLRQCGSLKDSQLHLGPTATADNMLYDIPWTLVAPGTYTQFPTQNGQALGIVHGTGPSARYIRHTAKLVQAKLLPGIIIVEPGLAIFCPSPKDTISLVRGQETINDLCPPPPAALPDNEASEGNKEIKALRKRFNYPSILDVKYKTKKDAKRNPEIMSKATLSWELKVDIIRQTPPDERQKEYGFIQARIESALYALQLLKLDTIFSESSTKAPYQNTLFGLEHAIDIAYLKAFPKKIIEFFKLIAEDQFKTVNTIKDLLEHPLIKGTIGSIALEAALKIHLVNKVQAN